MQAKNKSVATGALVATFMLLVALLLAACGEPTATPVPPATATTAPTTTAPTTAAPTTAPATTAAPATTTAVATTVAATTARPATTAAAGSTTLTLPTFSGTSEIALDAAIAKEILKQLPGVSDAAIKFYASTDDADTVAATVDKALVGAGYKFGLPGSSAPSKQGDAVVGFYVKPGAPDLLLAVGPVPADPSNIGASLNIPGISPDAAQKLVDQVKGKKSLLFIIGANTLLQGLLGAASGSGTATTAAATTAAATSTTAAASGGADVGESDVPVYSGAKRVDTVSGSVGGLTSVYYTSTADYDKITAWAKTAFTEKGFTEVNTLEAGGATVVTGKKGKYNLIGTIVGPKARGNASFDNIFKQAGAGPDDTVIAVVITN